jgi:WD40 repeat protein/serine/threonine protein kinase
MSQCLGSATPMADRDLIGRTLGDFVLLELIGGGGYGAVYRCRQPLLGREVAVKVLHARHQSNVALERFEREARLASRLAHPYAAHVYNVGAEEDGLLWIAMELVQGITLTEWLKKHGPMPLHQFVPFFECVAEVVQAAHDRGIVHRDLKPSNMMVIERDGRLVPKLLDFGIAHVDQEVPAAQPKRDDERRTGPNPDAPKNPAGDDQCGTHSSSSVVAYRLTRTGARFGSAPYMSPEQWYDAGAVGPASDIYSLGIVAYEALSGRAPFSAETTDDYFDCHRDAEVPAVGAGGWPELDQIVRRALAKSPKRRHGNALELASEFRAALRASDDEQLKSLARVWDDRARPPALLMHGGDLLRTPPKAAGELERAFVAASYRHTRFFAWLWRGLAVSAAALVLGAVWYHGAWTTRVAKLETRAAQDVARAVRTQAELEQGRAALLHNEPDAGVHLAYAYRRDPAGSTAFMLARALQPRLAEEARLASSYERMWSVAFSPDGKQLVTTDDKNAQLWDAQSQQLLFTLKHGDVVYHAVYGPDGGKVVTACGDGIVRIWDATNGRLIRELGAGTVNRRFVVALSADGKLVAGLGYTAFGAGVAHVWNADTGAFIAELADSAASTFPSLAFSSDGRWLVMGTGNGVQVFETRKWSLTRTILGPGIHSLAVDPSGQRLVTGSSEGNVSIWAIPSGQRIRSLREVGEPIDAVAFSPDGARVVTGSREGAVQVWEATSGKLQSHSNLVQSKVLWVEFDRTSSLVVASSSSGAVAVSDAASGLPVTLLEGPTAVVRVAHFDPSSRRVVGASWDGTARIWDARAPYRRWSSPPTSDGCDLLTSPEPDRRFLAISCKEQPTRIWDTAHDQLVAELPHATYGGADGAFAYPALSAEGERAAIARGGLVEVYELPAARLLRTIKHGASVNAVAFARSGRDLVSGAIDGSVIVTRDNGATTTLPTSSASVDAVGFLPDGRVLVADARRHLRVYDPVGTTLAELETHARVAMLRMSPDGRRLVTVSDLTGKTPPELWNMERYQPIARLSATGQGQAYSARFIGSDVITAAADGAVRLWGGEAGELRRTYRSGSRFLVDATLSADGTMLIGGGGDGRLRFWEFASGRPLWTMQAHRSHLIGVHVDGESIVTRGFSGEIVRWSLPKPEQVIEACDRSRRCAIVAP